MSSIEGAPKGSSESRRAADGCGGHRSGAAVHFRMPDLTGRSLEEIEGRLSEGTFRPADFAR